MLVKMVNFPKKSKYKLNTILAFLEMKIRKCLQANLAEELIILLNCPKGRKVT